MGYAPDLAARNLNRKQTNLIGGFASPYTHFSAGINEPLLDGIAEVMHSQDYDAFFEISRREPTANVLPFWRFDGAICCNRRRLKSRPPSTPGMCPMSASMR